MSGLSRWLEWDRERPDLDGGAKTPAFIDIPVHPSLGTVVVSKPNGFFQVFHRSNMKGEQEDLQRTGSFKLAPETEAEDEEQGRLVEYLYTQSARRNWGNAVRRERIDLGFVEEAQDYLEEFKLDIHAIHVGGRPCRQFISEDVVDLTEDLEEPSDGELSEAMEENYAIGKVEGKPLFFNPHLGDLAVFTAESEYVGIGIRIQDRVAILIHNPIRSLVFAEVT